MTDLETARQSVIQAEQVIAQREQAQQRAEQQAQALRVQRLTTARQLQLKRQGQLQAYARAGGLRGERARTEALRQKQLAEVSRERGLTEQYKKEVAQTKSEIATVEAEQTRAARYNQALKLVQKKGAAARYIAKGSDISQYVKQILDASNISDAKWKTSLSNQMISVAEVKAIAQYQRDIKADEEARIAAESKTYISPILVVGNEPTDWAAAINNASNIPPRTLLISEKEAAQKPKLNWWERNVKAAYIASPFGIFSDLPTEYHEQREKKVTIIGLDSARDALLSLKERDKKQFEQGRAIEQYNLAIEGAPENQKYYAQQTALKQLEGQGVFKSYITPKGSEPLKADEFTFRSQAMTPLKSFQLWQTEKEKTGFGRFLLGVRGASTALTEGWIGMKAVNPLFKKVLGAAASVAPKTTSIVSKVGGVGIATWIGYSGVKPYSQLTTPEEKSVFLQQFLGRIGGGLLGAYDTKLITKIFDIKKFKGMEQLELASQETKPFWRKQNVVYMRRATGFKLTKPKSWVQTLQGYKKGQFLKRQYRIISPEVMGRYEGKKEVTYWRMKKDERGILKPFLAKQKTTPFPYDYPSEHLGWFQKGNIQQFGLPKRAQIPKWIPQKAFGYSATGQEWNTLEIAPTGQYYSGKGVSVRFLRLGAETNPQLLGQAGEMGQSSVIYAGYTKGARINKGIEIKVPSTTGGKPIKTYKFSKPIKEAVFEIPKYKKEVEAEIFGQRIPFRRQFYISLSGEKVPIEEQTFTELLSKQSLNKLKNLGAVPVSERQSSVLPSIYKPERFIRAASSTSLASSYPTSRTSGRYSLITPPSKTSKSNIYNLAMSRLSSLSFKSSKSNISSLSRAPSSLTSKPSQPSKPSKPSRTTTGYSTTYVPPTRRIITPPPSRLYGYLSSRSPYQETAGFIPLIKRFGKWKPLSSRPMTRSAAIQLGMKGALGGLGRSFRIVQSGRALQRRGAGYMPSEYQNLFRSYKISQGRRIPLLNQFIQKKGTTLMFRGERAEIQTAAKRKRRKRRYNVL